MPTGREARIISAKARTVSANRSRSTRRGGATATAHRSRSDGLADDGFTRAMVRPKAPPWLGVRLQLRPGGGR